MRKCLDLLSNSLNTFFNKMYRDQFGEFKCILGLKGLTFVKKGIHMYLPEKVFQKDFSRRLNSPPGLSVHTKFHSHDWLIQSIIY